MTERNLFPRDFNQFKGTMLSSQEKWDLVFEKLIAVFDRLENKPVEVEVPKKK